MPKASRSKTSHSRMVRRLAHRSPVPRTFTEKLLFLLARFRFFPTTLTMTLILLTGGFAFVNFMNQSEYFLLSRIDVRGNERLSKDHLARHFRESSGVELGVSTGLVDAHHLEASLVALPEILDADVKKRWPSGLSVLIKEREAEGILISSHGNFVFDNKGYVFSAATVSDFQNNDLPVLTGFSDFSAERGVSLPADQMKFIQRYDQVISKASPVIHKRISEYHFEREKGLTLVLEDGARYHCGYRPPAETGPMVEVLALNQSHAESIKEAVLLSDRFVTIKRNLSIELAEAESSESQSTH